MKSKRTTSKPHFFALALAMLLLIVYGFMAWFEDDFEIETEQFGTIDVFAMPYDIVQAQIEEQEYWDFGTTLSLLPTESLLIPIAGFFAVGLGIWSIFQPEREALISNLFVVAGLIGLAYYVLAVLGNSELISNEGFGFRLSFLICIGLIAQRFIPNDVRFAIGSVFLSMSIAFVVTTLLVLALGKPPFEVVENVWEGAFRNNSSVAKVVNFWIPLTLVSMGLVVTFRAGLWNIGIEGQMMAGAVFASGVALFSTEDQAGFIIPLSIVMAAVGGMIWASLAGILKVYLGVNEIFGGVALNALMDVLAIFLISSPWQPEIGGSAQGTEPFPEHALLPDFSPDFQVNMPMLVFVLLASIAVVVALRGTRWGLNLKAVGKNPRSALLLGVPTGRTAMSAFLVCGALAGVAGSYRVLFSFDNLRPLASGGIGFLGLLVVLLVGMRGLWVPFIGFAFAALLAGSTKLRLALQLDSSVVEVLQGILVLLILLFNGIRQVYFSDETPPESDQPLAEEVTS